MTKRRPSAKSVAKKLTDYLFTNGSGVKADSLVLVNDKYTHDLGGWGWSACYNVIYDHIKDRLEPKP